MASPRPNLPLELLCCPRCRGPLSRTATLACAACAVEYPEIGGLPWLFTAPGLALGEWRARIHGFLAGLDAQAQRYRAALGDDVTRAGTRNRLKLLAAACADHARRLRALLAPVLGDAPAAAPEMYSALGMTVPTGQGLTSYYANLHRDWCWGDAENAAGWRILDAALGTDPPGNTLLLGIGAGRLAYDLVQARTPDVLVAADLNPLFLYAVQSLFAGERLELYEFPLAPRDAESHALLRTLQAPAAVSAGCHLVCADVSNGPFAPGAFDTVITPWLIDVVDEDLATFAARINGWLKPGGRWINTGSLSFAADDPARRYALAEVIEIVAGAGFNGVEPREESIPYLCSPASRHGRIETVVTFAARKRDAVPMPAPPRRLPDWLQRDDAPVPLLPELQARQLELRVLAHVASLVDGRRSIRDVARVLVEQRLMAPGEAEATVRSFLARLQAEAQARVGAAP
ncbi:MAG: class I SAM-dependent methyltransferase [Steroidobacteraceae bacterium]|nr:class I SAM-dependent methyltransferase [Steroidobacteraceae bacterium]